MSDIIPPPNSPSDQLLDAGLYIVATPIGNLGDITLRAVDVLRRCDAVACEDTRVTGKLLKHLGLSKRLIRYDDHADARHREQIVELARGSVVALVSDAGTPLISDPGYRLVKDMRAEGIPVTTAPGVSAVIAGVTLAGLPNDRFLFAGFMPSKDKARRDALCEFAALDATLVFYETGPRLGKTLAAIEALLPDREVAVARELTKLHEEVQRGLPSGLMAWFDAHPPKGEIVLLIAPPGEAEVSDHQIDSLLLEALMTNKTSQAAAEVARATGRDRKALYARAMELRSQ
ncbi:16S rRNA (cytidine(1402)-2'-O)-methyltransferase [Qipengyuania sp. DGS5-3]|uniref:16S rRNA (cytidine(1402)-2'-O)-methyltransferase n=1 Tax=Qipengyuania sp. DGS5-3 TaxID=3349632 RepID=UPI0036D27DD0